MSEGTGRRLVVVRHAKAEAGGEPDFDRELTDRGRADAAEAGRWLAEQGIAPDGALVSAARRAVGTWESLAGAGGFQLAPVVSESLYAASSETAVDLIREVPDEVSTLVVVGHNPTMASLAQLLDDGTGDEEAGRRMATGFPTTSVACFAVDGSWADLDLASARLTVFHVGRG